MIALTIHNFSQWMKKYGQASMQNDPRSSSELFALDAAYYETPFNEPICGREAIYKYWEKGAQLLTNKTSSYEVLSVKGNIGIARWQSKFTNKGTGKRTALDCVFIVQFDDDGQCNLFREWWHIQPVDAI